MKRIVFVATLFVASFANAQQNVKSSLTISSSNQTWNAFANVEAIQAMHTWREKQKAAKGHMSKDKEIDSLVKSQLIVKLCAGEKVNYIGTFSLRRNSPQWSLDKLTTRARVPTNSLVYKVQVLSGKLKGKTFFVEYGVLGGAYMAKD